MSQHAPSSIAGDMSDNNDDNRSRRGSDEAEEEGAQGAPKAAARKQRVRINRDQGDVPPVRDDTGEKVTELFQQFLEQ